MTFCALHDWWGPGPCPVCSPELPAVTEAVTRGGVTKNAPRAPRLRPEHLPPEQGDGFDIPDFLRRYDDDPPAPPVPSEFLVAARERDLSDGMHPTLQMRLRSLRFVYPKSLTDLEILEAEVGKRNASETDRNLLCSYKRWCDMKNSSTQ